VRASAIALLSVLVACGSPTSSPVDGGAVEAPVDASAPLPDAGAPGEDAGLNPRDAGPPDAGPPDAGPPPPPPLVFTEVGEAAGLLFENTSTDRLCAVHAFGNCDAVNSVGSAAVADVDGDGWLDVFLSGLEGVALYRNLGDGTFADITDTVGIATGVGTNGAVWADTDRDGDLDLYVATNDSTESRLYNFHFEQQADGTFLERSRELGTAIETVYPHAGGTVSVGDYDLDGWPDLHVSEWMSNNVRRAPHTRLLRNRGAAMPGHFDDVTQAAGVRSMPDECWIGDLCDIVAFASSFTDMDDDGFPDLLLVQDFGLSRLFWNDGDGTFTEGTRAANVGTDENGMGSTVGDIDGDGDLDWFVSSIGDTGELCGGRLCQSGYNGNRLYRNEGGRVFSDQTDAGGVRRGGWGWGTALFDFDNDGDLDLAMVNGFTIPDADWDDAFTVDRARFWENGGLGGFFESSQARGFVHAAHATGLVVFDYDNDGDQDVLAVESTGPVRLWRNDGGSRNPWLRVRLRGTASAPDGLHARIRVQADEGGPVQVREMGSITHFQGQSEHIAHLGFGDRGEGPLHRVVIDWPSGRRTELSDVAVRQLLVVDEPPE
jgi:hypothetical protein